MMFANQLDDRQLRYFGGSLCAVLMVFAGLAHWAWRSTALAIVLTTAAIVLGVMYYAVPATQLGVYRAFRLITLPIAMTMTVVVLALVYYLVITPIGLVLQWRGTSIAERNGAADSYWIDTPQMTEISQYFRSY